MKLKKAAIVALTGLMAVSPITAYAGQTEAEPDELINADVSLETESDNSTGSHLMGGWIIPENKTAELPAEVLEAFNKATADFYENEYKPVALLGSQVVAGMNYKILCTSNAEGSDSLYYVLTIYADLEGNASVTAIEEFNFFTDETYDEELMDGDIEIPEEFEGIWEKIDALYEQLHNVCVDNIDTWIKLYGNADSSIVTDHFDEIAYIDASELTSEEKKALLDEIEKEVTIYQGIDSLWDEYYTLIDENHEPGTYDNSDWNMVSIYWNRAYSVEQAHNDIWEIVDFLTFKYYEEIDNGEMDTVSIINDTTRLTDQEKEIALKDYNVINIFNTQADILSSKLNEDSEF